MIKLFLLGESWVSINESNITTKLSKKSLGLLIYMVCKNQKMYYREALASLFWPDYTKESSLNNLRHSLWQIRKQCKNFNHEDILKSKGNQIVFVDFSNIQCDYLQYINYIKNDDFMNASNLYNGDFLEDFYISDVPEFNDWVFQERESIQRKFFDITYKIADKFANNNMLIKATKSLNTLIRIDPLNEEVYYKLIKYQYLSGNKVAAINTYRRIKKILRDDLSISPSLELQELYKKIYNETYTKTSTPSFDFSGIQKTIHKVKIYSLSDDIKIKNHYNILSQYNNNSECLVIDICETPGERVNYEGLFEILDGIQEKGKYNPKVYINKLESIITNIKNETVSNDIFLFSQFKTLFSEELSKKLIFRIWGMHFLDSKTIDFISYIFRNEKDKKIILTGIYDTTWPNNRLEKFIKAFSKNPNTN